MRRMKHERGCLDRIAERRDSLEARTEEAPKLLALCPSCGIEWHGKRERLDDSLAWHCPVCDTRVHTF